MSIVTDSDLEELRSFEEDSIWFQNNYESIKENHKGEYVAVKDSLIICSNKNLEELKEKLKEKNIEPASTVVEYVKENEYEYNQL